MHLVGLHFTDSYFFITSVHSKQTKSKNTVFIKTKKNNTARAIVIVYKGGKGELQEYPALTFNCFILPSKALNVGSQATA